jgi:ABC-type sugar transport system permease subunit
MTGCSPDPPGSERKTMSDELKCTCQYCNGHIAFPPEMLGQSINCPHCQLETLLFMPASANPPKNPSPARKNKSRVGRVWLITGLVMTVAVVETFIQLFNKGQPPLPAIGMGFLVAGIAVLAVVALGVALAVYFLPAIVGRHKRNATAILVLNLLAGWTFRGWVIALVWACTVDAEVKAQQ